MSLRLLSWNVRGLNNPRKREVYKNLLKDWRCDVVCLQETKLSSLNSAIVRSLWGSPFIDWAVLDAVQSSRGVLLILDKRVVEKIDVFVAQFSVSVFLGELGMVLNGFAPVFMVPMLIIIGLLCGRSCPRYVSGGTQHVFYLVTLILSDTHVRGLVASLLAQP